MADVFQKRAQTGGMQAIPYASDFGSTASKIRGNVSTRRQVGLKAPTFAKAAAGREG